jgi:hypothetical protein
MVAEANVNVLQKYDSHSVCSQVGSYEHSRGESERVLVLSMQGNAGLASGFHSPYVTLLVSSRNEMQSGIAWHGTVVANLPRDGIR